MEASEILQKIGLSKGESRVYLKLLELGEAKTGLLSDKAKVSRSKIYEILEKLKEKGLASSVIKENIAYFSAGSPENLKDYIEKRKKDVLDDEKELSDIMPQLLGLNNLKKEKQNSLVYEGYKGIKVVFNQILDELKKNQEYYVKCADVYGNVNFDCGMIIGTYNYAPEE